MNLHDVWRNVLRGRARALPAAAVLLLLVSGGALQAAPPPPCFQQAASLGVLLNNIQVCWNDFTGEFELYFNPQTGITGGGCGPSGITVLAITGGTLFNPPNLPWAKIILPDDPDPDPEDTISLTFRARGHKKPQPVTPLEFTTSLTFFPRAIMDASTQCVQVFP